MGGCQVQRTSDRLVTEAVQQLHLFDLWMVNICENNDSSEVYAFSKMHELIYLLVQNVRYQTNPVGYFHSLKLKIQAKHKNNNKNCQLLNKYYETQFTCNSST